MNAHEDRLIAFLAGELDAAAARRFDEHLIECDTCWRAVREDRWARAALEGLREVAPPGLTDRVRMAVELSAATSCRTRRRSGAIAGLVSAVIMVAAGLSLWLLPARPSNQGALPAVIRIAVQMQTSTIAPASPVGSGGPVALGASISLSAGGQRIQITYYRMDGEEAVVATSPSMFPMPAGGRAVPGTGDMAWVAQQRGIGLYCSNGPRSVLAAGAMPSADLRDLVHQLHLG